MMDRIAPRQLPVTTRRRLVTGIATVIGALAGWVVFGVSPLILLGVLVGFLAGQTVHGLVYPKAPEEEFVPDQGTADPEGAPDGTAPPRYRLPLSSSPKLGLGLTLAAWGFGIVFLGTVTQWGWLRGEGAGLLLVFIVLPVLTTLALTGGPTASAAARRALKQIEAGRRPEADLGKARLALALSRFTTVVFLAFLVWLLVRMNS